MSGPVVRRVVVGGTLLTFTAAVVWVVAVSGPPPARAWFPDPSGTIFDVEEGETGLDAWTSTPTVTPGGPELDGRWTASASCGLSESPDALELSVGRWYHPFLKLVGRPVTERSVTYEFGTSREVDGKHWLEFVRAHDATLGDDPIRRDDVVGPWQHSVHFGDPMPIELCADGSIRSDADGATWSLDGTTLTMRWPSDEVEGGVWIDACEIAPDTLSYRGYNQRFTRIDGRRAER